MSGGGGRPPCLSDSLLTTLQSVQETQLFKGLKLLFGKAKASLNSGRPQAGGDPAGGRSEDCPTPSPAGCSGSLVEVGGQNWCHYAKQPERKGSSSVEADAKTSQFPVAAQRPGREPPGLARPGPGWLHVGITERWRGGLEAPGLGALATCPAQGEAALTGPPGAVPEGRDCSCLNPEQEWRRRVSPRATGSGAQPGFAQ